MGKRGVRIPGNAWKYRIYTFDYGLERERERKTKINHSLSIVAIPMVFYSILRFAYTIDYDEGDIEYDRTLIVYYKTLIHLNQSIGNRFQNVIPFLPSDLAIDDPSKLLLVESGQGRGPVNPDMLVIDLSK